MKNVNIVETEGRIVIQTELGDIFVQPASDPSYPGVCVDFQPKGQEYTNPVCLVEATPDDKTEETEAIRLLVWTGDEDYSYEFTYAKKDNKQKGDN